MLFNLVFNFINYGLLVRFLVDPYSIDDSVEEGPEVLKVGGDVVVLKQLDTKCRVISNNRWEQFQ